MELSVPSAAHRFRDRGPAKPFFLTQRYTLPTYITTGIVKFDSIQLGCAVHIAVCQGGKIVIGDQFLVKIEESDEVGLDDGDKVFGELGRIESKDEAPRFDYGGTTFAERADVMKLNTASRLGEATI